MTTTRPQSKLRHFTSSSSLSVNSPFLLDAISPSGGAPFASPALRADSVFSLGLGSPFFQQFPNAVPAPSGMASVSTTLAATSSPSSTNANGARSPLEAMTKRNWSLSGGGEQEETRGEKKQRTRTAYSLSLVPTLEELSTVSSETGEPSERGRSRLDSELLVEVLETLLHSVECTRESDEGGDGCISNKCATMKALVAHALAHDASSSSSSSPFRTESGMDDDQLQCELCSRYRFILSIHVRLCDRAIGRCRVPFCSRLKLEIVSNAAAAMNGASSY